MKRQLKYIFFSLRLCGFASAFGMLYIIGTMLTMSSCRRPFDDNANVLKIDTIEKLVNYIDETLILDEDVFKLRDDSMLIKLKLVIARYKDTTDGVTVEAITRYRGIEKTYQDFLKNYPVMEFDNAGYLKSINDIKQKVLNKAISQEAFDDYYSTTFPKLTDLLKRAKTMTYNTSTIEHDYDRTDPIVTGLYHKLKGDGK